MARLEDWQMQVIEKEALDVKINNLESFLQQDMDIDEVTLGLMQLQLGLMQCYSRVLGIKIFRFLYQPTTKE